MRDKQIPGLSVGVLKKGKTLLMKGYGLANLEHSVPATESTVYEVASVGKTFTAMVVMMLERFTNRSYGDLMQELLFKPLEMNSTKMNNPEEILPHRASGYRLVEKNKLINKPYYSPSMTFSAGGQLSSIEDMVKYEQELCCPTLIKQATLDLMWTPIFPGDEKSKYTAGLGWFIPDYQNLQIVMHNGSILGFASNITRFINHHLTVILFCNIDTIVRPDAIALEIARYYCPELGGLSIQPPIS